MNTLSKEEFRERLLADQEKRKEAKKRKKIVKVGLPFKQEAYVDVVQLLKENYPDAEIQKGKEIIVEQGGQKHSIKIVEKRGKVDTEEKEINEDELMGQFYKMILQYYSDTESN